MAERFKSDLAEYKAAVRVSRYIFEEMEARSGDEDWGKADPDLFLTWGYLVYLMDDDGYVIGFDAQASIERIENDSFSPVHIIGGES